MWKCKEEYKRKDYEDRNRILKKGIQGKRKEKKKRILTKKCDRMIDSSLLMTPKTSMELKLLGGNKNGKRSVFYPLSFWWVSVTW